MALVLEDVYNKMQRGCMRREIPAAEVQTYSTHSVIEV
jgi:hypothetical protein